MARVYTFHALPLPATRAALGSRDARLRALLGARLDAEARDPSRTSEPAYYEAAARVADALIFEGALPPSSSPLENAAARALIRMLLTAGPAMELGPEGDRFTYALTQIALTGGVVDDAPLGTTDLERAVLRALADGRSLFGEAVDRHDAHGWLAAGDEVRALAAIVASPVWATYVGAGRFRASAVAAFESEREAYGRWLADVARDGKDLFFCQGALEVATPCPITPLKKRKR
jgi:hypothetical protein